MKGIFFATAPGLKKLCFDELMSLSLSGKMAIVVECGVLFKDRVNDCYIANLKLDGFVKSQKTTFYETF